MLITAVVKDENSRIISWRERDYAYSLTRDGSGRPLFLRGTSAGGVGVAVEFNYRQDGSFSSMVGATSTVLISEILADAAGLSTAAGGPGGGLSAPVAKSSLSSGVQASLDKADTALQAADISGKANLASPAFTGTPTVPTAAAGTNTTQAASTAFVAQAIAALVASSPSALDTLNELAAALGNDSNFATTVTNALAGKAAAPTAPVAVAASRALTNADAGKTLDVTASGVTLTVPNGLNLVPGVIIQKHSGGTSVAVSGGATINGATTTLALTANVAALVPSSTADAYKLAGV